jgi:hypothetical protein
MAEEEKAGLQRLLSAPDKAMTEPKGAAGLLAQAWRIILFKLRMNPARMNAAMNAYSRALVERGVMDKIKANQERGNIRSSMASDRMSFRKLWQNLCVIGAIKVELNLRVHFPNNQVVEAKVSLRNSFAGTESEEDNESAQG